MQWKHWFAPYPELDYIQLEVSTHCNAFCAYCPRTTAGSNWNNIHLMPSTLRPLLRHLPNVPYVHLQGWGEPLLNPHFFDLVKLLKAHGCRCGTTTNGILLNDSNVEKIINSEIDLVALSLTGAGASHDRFRQGAPLAAVLQGIRTLAAAKGNNRKNGPAIHIAYMLLRDGIDELGALPALLDGLTINEIVVSTLDHVPHPVLADQVVVHGTPEWAEVSTKMTTIQARLAAAGTRLIFGAATMTSQDHSATCSEQVDRALIIAADGGIHPCVFANLPDAATGRKRKCFGYLAREGLDKAWWSDAYQNFRASFGNNQLDELCIGCPKRPIQI
jgi:MoaA/NifB/PqqE/SkfB family radical SAM enzyme